MTDAHTPQRTHGRKLEDGFLFDVAGIYLRCFFHQILFTDSHDFAATEISLLFSICKQPRGAKELASKCR